MSEGLEERLRRLEDIQEIHRLKSLYAKYWNFGWEAAGANGAEVAKLFTEDAFIDYGAFGRADGRQAIAGMVDAWAAASRAAADGTPLAHPGLSVHFLTTPNIEVTGDEAVGTWTGMVTATADGTPMWIAGQYTDRFVRRDDAWQIKSVLFEYAFATPFAGAGWVLERFPAMAGA